LPFFNQLLGHVLIANILVLMLILSVNNQLEKGMYPILNGYECIIAGILKVKNK
jgi:hypothetical protein